MKELVTQKDLKTLFKYDQETGNLTWNKRRQGAKLGQRAGYFDKKSGYNSIRIDGILYQAHRLVWLYHYGEWPKYEMDHIDGNRLNNRVCNLRDVERFENSRNHGLRSDSTSGVVGVSYNKEKKKWDAYINVHGIRKRLGRFVELDDAVTARKAAESKYAFHENHGTRDRWSIDNPETRHLYVNLRGTNENAKSI